MNRRHFLASSLAFGTALSIQSKEQSPYRVAIVGHTNEGNYGHDLDGIWLRIPQTQIIGVADPNPKGLKAAQKKLGVSQAFANYQELFKQTQPQIVSVASRWVNAHRDIILSGIEHGVKGFYVEKPFCRTLKEADDIVKACQENKVALALAHRNRFHPVLPVVKKLIDDGLIGKVLEMRGRGKEDARGGSLDLWVLGSHVLNLAQAFAGKPKSCSAVLKHDGALLTKKEVNPNGAEGVGALGGNELHARYEFENGWTCYYDSIKNHGVNTAGFGLQIIGTEGIVDLRIDESPLAHFAKGNPFDPQTLREPWIPISTAGVGQPEPNREAVNKVGSHIAAIENLLDCMQSGNSPICNEIEGRDTIEMIFAAFESHVQGGKIVSIPLQNRENPLDRLS